MASLQQWRGENQFGNTGFFQLRQARMLLAGHGFGRMVGEEFFPDLFLRPTYSLLLAPLVAVLDEYSTTFRVLVAAAQGAALGCVGLMLGGVLRRVGELRAAALAPWLIVCHPLLLSQAASIVDTTLFTVLFCVSFALLDRAACAATSRTRWMWAGLAFGAAVLTRSVAVTLGPALLRRGWTGTKGMHTRLVAALIFVLAAAAVVTSWLARNHALTGRVMLSTTGAVNIWMGNNAKTAEFLDQGKSLDYLPGRQQYDSLAFFRIEDQLASFDAGGAAARAWMAEHPGEAAVLAVRKAGYLWSPVVLPRSIRSRMTSVKDLVGLLWTVPMYLLALVGVVVGWRRGGASRWLVVDVGLIAVCFTAPHALAWGGTRLRAPIDPFLLMVAAIGLAAVIERVRSRRGTPRPA